ncbi:ERF family protein [Rhizobium sp. ARZ01]|uniref:ERF family protein n=1 Tax=Rhizobium sp. ARZ01 TaxID=2769313 RepID=UPI001782CBCC|nr:ERF family protein [Rhizobium sp. ARZ01]MBD9372805.1 ERF family protein [Rhizobium sp. ARZ01]
MNNVIDPPPPGVWLGDASNGVIAKAKQAMEARKMENAVQVHTPSQLAVEQPRAVMTPMEMVGRALEMGVSADILKQMMDLRDREEANRGRKAFDAAISRAKADITPVVKNATGHNSKRYADFSAIARAVDPILSRNGLSYRFKTTQADKINVTCILSHEDGHSEETSLSAPADTSGNKNAIQAIGSTLTYLQRYSLIAALGLAVAEDDDGRAAGQTEQERITPEQVKIIQILLDQTKSDTEQFCKMGKIDALPDMLASQFDSAVRILNDRKAKMSQRAAS